MPTIFMAQSVLDFGYNNDGQLLLGVENNNNLMASYRPTEAYSILFRNTVQYDNVGFQFFQLSHKYNFYIVPEVTLTGGFHFANNYKFSDANTWLEIEGNYQRGIVDAGVSVAYDITDNKLLGSIGARVLLTDKFLLISRYGHDRRYTSQDINLFSGFIIRENDLLIECGIEVPEIDSVLIGRYTRFVISFGYQLIGSKQFIKSPRN